MSNIDFMEIRERKAEYAQHIFSGSLTNKVAVFNLLNNALKIAGGKPVKITVEQLMNESYFQEVQQQLLFELASLSSTEIDEKTNRVLYSTGDIAKMFGVTQTTIYRWIAQSRFEGISREETGKHITIPSYTLFLYPNGDQEQLSEIAARWKERKKQAEQESVQDELELATKTTQRYEEKYTSIENLKQKIQSHQWLGADYGLDLDIWEYFIERKNQLV